VQQERLLVLAALRISAQLLVLLMRWMAVGLLGAMGISRHIVAAVQLAGATKEQWYQQYQVLPLLVAVQLLLLLLLRRVGDMRWLELLGVGVVDMVQLGMVISCHQCLGVMQGVMGMVRQQGLVVLLGMVRQQGLVLLGMVKAQVIMVMSRAMDMGGIWVGHRAAAVGFQVV